VGSNPTGTAIQWGISSSGRATALQVVGDRFESDILHISVIIFKTQIPGTRTSRGSMLVAIRGNAATAGKESIYQHSFLLTAIAVGIYNMILG
jgi:hypothetical protein